MNIKIPIQEILNIIETKFTNNQENKQHNMHKNNNKPKLLSIHNKIYKRTDGILMGIPTLGILYINGWDLTVEMYVIIFIY